MDSHIRHRNYENLAFHPFNIFLILLIAAISALFIGLIIAYLYTRINHQLSPIRLPNIFYLTTFTLFISCYTINVAYQAYQHDRSGRYTRALWVTLALTLVFLGGQILGWRELVANHSTLQSGNGTAYLYMLSGVHFLHVLGGIPFLINFLFISQRQLKDPVTSLIYFSDPEKKLMLRMIRVYWYFLDYLWIFLMGVLLINYLI